MAAQKSYKPVFSGLQLEFDESEDWEDNSTTTTNYEVAVSEAWRSTVLENLSNVKKASVVEQVAPANATKASKSVPINIPDWKRILGVEYQEQRARQGFDYSAEEDDDNDEYGGLPPHEYLARTRAASLSVHEGVGRTLKGRDLWRFRNAIWKLIGFED